MKSKINVVIVDDHKLIRQGIKSLLEGHNHIQLVHEASDGFEITTWFKEGRGDTQVDVILMDMQMPKLNGWEATESLLKKDKNVKVIGLSSYDDDIFIEQFILSGGRGYLLKDQEIGEVVDAIEDVYESGYYFSDRVPIQKIKRFIHAGKINPNIKYTPLTNQEIKIVRMICEQLNTQEIADVLFVNKKTVETHRLRIMNKLKIKNMAGLVMYAVKQKLVKV
jgi:DNA-binding NarL/FixJ family response regulator